MSHVGSQSSFLQIQISNCWQQVWPLMQEWVARYRITRTPHRIFFLSNGWEQILLIMQDYVTGLEQLISSLYTLHLPHTATGAPDQPSKTAAPGLCILITLFCTDFRVFVNYQSVKNDSWRCWSECHGNQFRWNYFTLLIVFLFGLINRISRNHQDISRLRIEIRYSVIFALQRKQFSSSYGI